MKILSPKNNIQSSLFDTAREKPKPQTYNMRDYQEEASAKSVYNLNNSPHPFFSVLPTGSGKSLIVADICHKINDWTLILQPSKEILEQNYHKLLSYGVQDVSIYSASFNSKTIDKYTYATIGSIYKHPEKFMKFRKVIVDECHGVNPKSLGGMYNQFFKAIGVSSICGLTASPYRIVQKFFKEGGDMIYTAYLQTINRIAPFFFKKMVYNISIQELLNRGYLAPFKYKYYNDFDTSNIKINTTGADFDQEAMNKFWSDDRLFKMSQIIQEVDAECKSNLIFCSSIKQAKRCCEMLTHMGLSSDFISSEFKPGKRDQVINDFKAGKIKHVCNVGVLTTGFDYPELDCITLARPTMSLALYYQMAGRGMRIDPNNPNKVCKIVDICEISKRMGRVETIRMAKEADGFRDIVMSEMGEITNKPLFRFRVKDEKLLKQLKENFNENDLNNKGLEKIEEYKF